MVPMFLTEVKSNDFYYFYLLVSILVITIKGECVTELEAAERVKSWAKNTMEGRKKDRFSWHTFVSCSN